MSTFYRLGLLICYQGLLFTTVWADETTTVQNTVAYCQPYCDNHGFYQPGKYCIGDHRTVYCCGTTYERYCCYDAEDEALDNTPISTCPKSNWWFYQRLIVGMLTSLIIMLVLAACCYYCCSNGPQATSERSRRDAEMTSVSEVSLPGNFDPESPYAFQPPAYDSLPKDPPVYSELFGDATGDNNGPCEITTSQPEGCDNPSFEPENPPLNEEVATSPSPATIIRSTEDSIEQDPPKESVNESAENSQRINNKSSEENSASECDTAPRSTSESEHQPSSESTASSSHCRDSTSSKSSSDA